MNRHGSECVEAVSKVFDSPANSEPEAPVRKCGAGSENAAAPEAPECSAKDEFIEDIRQTIHRCPDSASRAARCTEMLFSSSVMARPEAVRMLIEAGADVNSRDSEGWPLLFYQAVMDNPDSLALLLEAGMNVNVKTPGNDPILIARQVAEKPELVHMLIEAGANVNAVDRYCLPIVFNQVILDNPDAFRMLVNAGADTNEYFNTGSASPIHSRLYKYPELMKIVMEKNGMDVMKKIVDNKYVNQVMNKFGIWKKKRVEEDDDDDDL